MFSNLGCRLTSWAQYHHIYFSKAALIISGLVFSHGLAENSVISILISYFMQENRKNINLRQAAAVVNVEEGASAIMTIIISCSSDAYFCRFKVIASTTALFIIGLLLLGVSTWLTPELEVPLFYPVVILIAVGRAGRDPSLKAFLADQLTDDSSKLNQTIDEEHLEARKNCWWRIAWSLGVLASFDLSIGSWRWNFLTSSMVMGAAYLWFLSGIKFYNIKKPTGSCPLITNIFKVFKAAVLKRHLAYPDTSNGYFKNDRDQLLLSPKVPFFRWLDKASIVESSSQLILEEQEITRRLCTVAQVKQVKCLLTIVPIWTTSFVVCGLVEATGRIFFIEQANNLDDKIDRLFIVPATLFITLKSLVRFVVQFLLQLLIPKWLISRANRQHITLVRISLGMVFSVLSCIAAWQLELHRLKLIKKSETMSIFWLAPQFTLLGLMGGFAEEGLKDLFHNHVAAESKKLYESSIFMDFTLGIGNFLSILIAFIFRSWFGDNINSSRLDKYFLMLAILAIGNLFLYCFMILIAYKFWCHDQEEESHQENVKLNLDDSLELDALTLSTDSVTNCSFSNNFFYNYTIINRPI